MLNYKTLQVGVIAVLLLSATFLLSSLTFNPPVKKLTVQEALQQNLITLDVISNGGYSEKSVKLRLKNNSRSALSLLLPGGTIYEPENGDEQTLIQLEDKEILVNGNGSFNGSIDAFCTEASDRCPSENGNFTIGSTNNDKLKKLVTFLGENKMKSDNFQSAVWAITDDHSVSNIDPNEAKSKALRKYLCEITGKKDNWYTSPQDVDVDPYGNFNFETVRINGEIGFDCNRGKKISEDICNAEGQVMFSSSSTFTPMTDHVRYNFNLSVKGWEKGDYYVLIKDETGELARFEFQV